MLFHSAINPGSIGRAIGDKCGYTFDIIYRGDIDDIWCQHSQVCRNDDLMEPGMLCQPGAGLGTVMAGEVVGDDEDVARRIVGFDIPKQSNVVRRVA